MISPRELIARFLAKSKIKYVFIHEGTGRILKGRDSI